MPSAIKHRDLTLTPLPGGTLVVACDSCGAVGEKPTDILKIPAYYTGRFTTRVALMEVLAFGAQPVTVADTISCEMEPTGRELIRGVRDELAVAGVDQAVLTGSTEENFPTSMTALGITVAGWKEGSPDWTPARCGDLVFCIGTPQVGAQVTLKDNKAIASYGDLNRFRSLPGLREIVPTGSHGIGWEVENLASYNSLRFLPAETSAVDLTSSTGPATCLVAVLDPSERELVEAADRTFFIGTLVH